MHTLYRSAAAAIAALAGAAVPAADWSDTELHFLHGRRFRDVSNDVDTKKNILTLQHASGYKFGRNFFFVDLIRSDSTDERSAEVYAEYYHTLSISKVGGFAWPKMPLLRDVGLTAALNYGAKNSTFGPNPKILLLGPTLDLAVPGFAFFNVDVLAYRDSGTFSGFGGGRLCGEIDTTYQITPAWKLPFRLGPAKFSFEGFLDLIGSHGTCHRQVLTQPQLRWDVGNHFGRADTVFLGFEYQYWRNKFGIEGRKESFPQLVLAWKL